MPCAWPTRLQPVAPLEPNQSNPSAQRQEEVLSTAGWMGDQGLRTSGVLELWESGVATNTDTESVRSKLQQLNFGKCLSKGRAVGVALGGALGAPDEGSECWC